MIVIGGSHDGGAGIAVFESGQRGCLLLHFTSLLPSLADFYAHTVYNKSKKIKIIRKMSKFVNEILEIMIYHNGSFSRD